MTKPLTPDELANMKRQLGAAFTDFIASQYTYAAATQESTQERQVNMQRMDAYRESLNALTKTGPVYEMSRRFPQMSVDTLPEVTKLNWEMVKARPAGMPELPPEDSEAPPKGPGM